MLPVPSNNKRKIIHIDMDAFFVAIEMRDHPELLQRPVAVGGLPENRGVIATANYIARKCGVSSAQPSWQALNLCPDLIILKPRMEIYRKESKSIQKIFSRYSDIFEPLSLDEAYLDVSNCRYHYGSATWIASEIRAAIKKERNLTASAGVAPNKFLAKVASDWNKPDGQFVIAPCDVEIFIKKLPIKKLWGVGKMTYEKLKLLHIDTCEDLQRLPLLELQHHFGLARAFQLFTLSRGIDFKDVQPNRIRKSISSEVTLRHNVSSLAECEDSIDQLYVDLLERFKHIEDKYVIKGMMAKIRFADFTITTTENSSKDISKIAFLKLLEESFERKSQPTRLLGIGFRLSYKEEKQLLFWESEVNTLAN